ncbi:MAG: hypothetical protein ACON5K_05190 [Bacteroidia bacterium]
MKFKRIWIPYDKQTYINRDKKSNVLNCNIYPVDSDKSKKADNIIEKMLNEGWKIVSTTPVTASENSLLAGDNDVYWTFTSGIEVFMIKEG